MQARYQYGTLTLRKRKRGPGVWQWRWTENGRRKSILIGTKDKYPTRTEAERALEAYRLRINAAVPQARFHPVTVNGLIDRYAVEEMPKRCRHETQRIYLIFLNAYIRPRWGNQTVQSVKTIAIEDWLGSIPRSDQTKSHVRNVMHVLFQSAVRWELIDRNPVTLVRQSRKRAKIPRVLTPKELRALLEELDEPFKTMVLVCGTLGLRASELLGLQWGDINWDDLTVLIQRSAVNGNVYDTKTEASRQPMPLDPELAEVLLRLRGNALYRGMTDFLFPGECGKPRWRDIILRRHINPAAARAGIRKMGWHCLRHTFSTLLHNAGTPLAVQKELLRHADIQTTMNIYTQAMSTTKREAAHKVVEVLLKEK